MKKLANILIGIFFTQCILAKSQKDWTVSFDTPIKWSRISSTGNLIVCTKDALYGIDPEIKGEAWRLPKLAEIEQS